MELDGIWKAWLTKDLMKRANTTASAMAFPNSNNSVFQPTAGLPAGAAAATAASFPLGAVDLAERFFFSFFFMSLRSAPCGTDWGNSAFQEKSMTWINAFLAARNVVILQYIMDNVQKSKKFKKSYGKVTISLS
jgi:hypothetical protein